MTAPDVERLERAADELRELMREAHGLIGDLRRECKDARELVPLLVDQQLEAEVTRQLAKLSAATKDAIDGATSRVYARFDKLSALVLGEDPQSRRKGKASLPQMIEKAYGNGG